MTVNTRSDLPELFLPQNPNRVHDSFKEPKHLYKSTAEAVTEKTADVARNAFMSRPILNMLKITRHPSSRTEVVHHSPVLRPRPPEALNSLSKVGQSKLPSIGS